MVNKKDAPYPYLPINGDCYDMDFLKSVESAIVRRSIMASIGIEGDPNPVYKFAYSVLKQIKMDDVWNE